MNNRTNKRRAKQRARTVLDLTQKVTDSLARLAEGKTPPERVQAYVDYYESCSNAEKLMLFEIFKKQEDKESTEIFNYFAEKQND